MLAYSLKGNDMDKKIDEIVRAALEEDIGSGDITSESVLDGTLLVEADIISREKGVVCGMDIIHRVFDAVDPGLKFRNVVSDGDLIEPGQRIASVGGRAHSVLKAERTVLNFLGLLSGVATRTREMVDLVSGTGVKIYDTRKTIPLLRELQKYAVTVGGGFNHRRGLWDMVLIKDNHIKAFGAQTKGLIREGVIKGTISRARGAVPGNIRVEIEVETLEECGWALEGKPDVIMLDNMSPGMIAEAVALRKDRGLEEKVLFEVSGGITKDNIRDYASTGADIISTGSITASIKPIDFSLEIVP